VVRTITNFNEAIERQEALVEEVRKLRVSNRRLGWLLVAGAITLAGVAAAAGVALSAASSARQANHDIKVLVDEREAARLDLALQACRLRNNTPRALRDGLNADIDATVDLLIAQDVEPETISKYARARRDAIPSVEETDRDCDENGAIDAGDYPQD
jgi:hypothetical protein